MRIPAVPPKLTATLVLVTLGLSACTGAIIPDATPETSPSTLPRPTTTAPPEPEPVAEAETTTTTALSAIPTTAAPLPGLGRGATGEAVRAVEEKLTALRYEVGKADGVFDAMTGHGVMAFQKAQGLARTGRATDDVVAALATASPPTALLPEGGAERVEIDLKRQILMLWQGGQLQRVLNTSTGTGKRYCVDGQCATAVTPGGSFRIGRKIRGLRVSRLGQLYNPLYFNGGIAIHGSASVPGGPASHGCVRIPMGSSLWFHDAVPSGTPVYVVGGKSAPVPFNEQAPTDDPAAATTTVETTTSTTSTTVPPILPITPEPTTTVPETTTTSTP